MGNSWYVFAAMGFYPVDPVSNEYELRVPLFDSVTIYLMSGKTFSIIVNKKSAGADIIGRMMLGGTPYKRHAIRYSDIMQGGKIVIYTR